MEKLGINIEIWCGCEHPCFNNRCKWLNAKFPEDMRFKVIIEKAIKHFGLATYGSYRLFRKTKEEEYYYDRPVYPYCLLGDECDRDMVLVLIDWPVYVRHIKMFRHLEIEDPYSRLVEPYASWVKAGTTEVT